jgi:ribosomal protein S18 acetylase RimI-like enzyme
VEVKSPLAALQLGDQFSLVSVPDSEWAEVPVQGTFREFWESRPFSLRRGLLRHLTSVNDPSRPRLEVVIQADPEFVNTLIKLLDASADHFTKAKDGAAAFLLDLTRALDDADMLRLFGLRFNGRLAAVLLAFAHRNTLYAFASGTDPELESQGFGQLLLFEALRHAFERGFRGWNFLRGNEPQKLLWGAKLTPTARITIARKPAYPPQLQ